RTRSGLHEMKSLTLAMMLLAPALLRGAASGLGAMLDKPILEPDLPLVEAQVFTATRVPPMPPITSAQQWTQDAERLRRRVIDEVILRGEARQWENFKTRVEWLDTIETDREYRLRKLRFEALPGLWVPALLYKPPTSI